MNRSRHTLSHVNNMTCDIGGLYPIAMVPVLPGDLVAHHTNLLVRLTPMAAPVMGKLDARVHHFMVPYRICDDGTFDWEEFITGGEDGMNTDTIPTVTSTATAKNLEDYFYIPRVAGIEINKLPIMAFNLIFNEWFRDQDLVTERSLTDVTIPKIAWGKDYFTTARPWAQKGPAVSLPIGDKANVHSAAAISGGNPTMEADADSTKRILATGGANLGWGATAPTGSEMYADLSSATGPSPVDFREAMGLQRFMEFRAKYGARYPELMRALGSTYQGAMDRPIYLGGGTTQVRMSEVLQTANDASDRDFGVGDMYGHGVAPMQTNRYKYKVGEHGVIISVLSLRPQAVYANGIHREWLRQDREDFHDPFLEFVGQQEIWENEIFADSAKTNADVWGYQDKYSEYRFHPSNIAGEFRDTLDYWTFARKFSTAPALDNNFVEVDREQVKRVFNEQTNNQAWVLAAHNMQAFRNISARAQARIL